MMTRDDHLEAAAWIDRLIDALAMGKPIEGEMDSRLLAEMREHHKQESLSDKDLDYDGWGTRWPTLAAIAEKHTTRGGKG